MRALSLAIASRQVSGVTGTTTTILEHTRRLRALGWAVHIFGDKIDRDRIIAAGGIPHRLPTLPLGGRLKRRLFIWLFKRAVKRMDFDIVSGHGDTLDQDVLSLHNCVHAAHEAIHGRPLAKDSSLGRLHGKILGERRFKLLIANSELMKREVISRFNVPEERVKVIHPGFDPKRFSAEGWESGLAARRELGVPEGGLLVGLITSGDFAKRGVGIFLEGLGRLPQSLKDRLHVLIVGRETRPGPYIRKAREAGLGARTVVLSPRPQVERYVHALDVFVHPALYEEFGQSVQEALACGTPVLTTKWVGAAELLGKEGRQYLMPKPEAALIARHLERLLKDKALRRRLSDEGMRATRNNTWEHNFRETFDCYQNLLKGRAQH